MTEIQSSPDSQSNYQRLAHELVAQYDETTQKQSVVGSCSDMLTDRDLVLCDQASGQRVAELAFDVDGDECAHLTTPADYTLPMDREPFTSIDSPETLPPAGELLYEVMQLIETVIQSSTEDSTHEQQLAELFEQLHQQHNYSSETIQTSLVESAQQWGDLPIDPRRVL